MNPMARLLLAIRRMLDPPKANPGGDLGVLKARLEELRARAAALGVQARTIRRNDRNDGHPLGH